MTFEQRAKPPKPGRDCKDFKPKFFCRRHCKLFDKCVNGLTFMEKTRTNSYCDGIHWYKKIGG